MLEEYGNLMTISEVSKELRLSSSSVRNMIHQHTFRAIKVGKKFLIPRQDLADYINSHTTESEENTDATRFLFHEG